MPKKSGRLKKPSVSDITPFVKAVSEGFTAGNRKGGKKKPLTKNQKAIYQKKIEKYKGLYGRFLHNLKIYESEYGGVKKINSSSRLGLMAQLKTVVKACNWLANLGVDSGYGMYRYKEGIKPVLLGLVIEAEERKFHGKPKSRTFERDLVEGAEMLVDRFLERECLEKRSDMFD